MELMKKHKFQILLPVALVLVALIAGILYNSLQGGTSSKRHCDLGQQYLNNLNYSGAVLEFTNAITLDPTNTDARVGLAQAYSASGDTDMAVTVLKDVLKDDKLDPNLCQALIGIYKDGGNHSGAIQLLNQLIQQTDDDAYYQQLQELMKEMYSGTRPYSSTTYMGHQQKIMISGDKVATVGNNTFGQLGTAASLGDRNYFSTDFANAGFPGQPKVVYNNHSSSFVIDSDSNLWAAGENGWGQFGLSYGSLKPESGWIQLTTTGDVADVAYTSGQLMVLKYDGTVWAAGAYIGQTLQPCANFSGAVKIAAFNGQLYVLDCNGKLYRSNFRNETLTWTVLGQNVMNFTASRYVLVWITDNGNFNFHNGLYAPDTWVYQDDGYKCPFTVKAMAAHDTHGLLMLSDEGKIMYLKDGNVKQIPVNGTVVSLYTTPSSTVAVLEDGQILVWEENSDFFTQGVTQ